MGIHHLAAAAFAVAVSASEVAAQEPAPELVIAQAFDLAMADLMAGKPELAIPLLRGILARDPGLDRVRLELARAYFEAREYGPAREQFRIVLSSPELPQEVRENVLRFLRAVDEARGLRTTFGLSVVAPTAAGRRYDTDSVLLDVFGTPLLFELNRPEVPDVAVRLEGSLRRQWALGQISPDAQSGAYVRAGAALEEAVGTDFDTRELELGTGLTLTWPRHTVSAEIFAAGAGISDELRETRTGLGLSYETRSASGRSYFASGSLARLEDHENEARGGHLTQARLGLAQTFASTGALSFSLGAELHDADRDDFSYSSVDALLKHQIDLEGGISLSGSLHFELFEQEAPAPGFLEARSETEGGIDIRLEKNDLFIANRYTPYVEVGFARRSSSIDAFSYSERRLEAGLSAAF